MERLKRNRKLLVGKLFPLSLDTFTSVSRYEGPFIDYVIQYEKDGGGFTDVRYNVTSKSIHNVIIERRKMS